MRIDKIVFLIAVLALFFAVHTLAEPITRLDLTEAELNAHAMVQKCVDQGDCSAFAEMLLNNQISDDLYALLLQENETVVETVTIDAMVQLGREGRTEALVQLRIKGYVPDEWLMLYWEVMGSEEPEESMRAEAGVDTYLIHELKQAFCRDDYAVRSFIEMNEKGILTEEMHAALVQALGFDYTDIHYLEENGIAMLRELTPEERLVYDEILSCIDEGDCGGVTERMLNGAATETLYRTMMQEDADMMDFIIAQAMAQYTANALPQNVVSLRQNGFVSDTCFEYYWENIGIGAPVGGSTNDKYPGTDLYLLYELQQIYTRDADGAQLLRELWNSGRLNDEMHELLVERLGVDYTRE